MVERVAELYEGRHFDQTSPLEWHACEHAGEVLIAHDIPEGSARCYRIKRWSGNPRAMVGADAVLWDGTVVTAWFNDTDYSKTIVLGHTYAGRMERLELDEWVQPAPLLERLNGVRR